MRKYLIINNIFIISDFFQYSHLILQKNKGMKRNLIVLFSFFLSFFQVQATQHQISAGNFYYSPNNIVINVGDTVNWINDGGYHNVNFDISTITGLSFNNPVAFTSQPTVANFLYSYVFNIPGIYQYDCSVGIHANNGMTGSIIVLSQNIDCNGIANGSALLDDCGVCHQAYLYNFISHTVSFLDDTVGVIPAWNQILVLPDNPSNPYWNSSCIDCNGIVNGSSIIDSCGVCQQSYIYNYVTHSVLYLDDTNNLVLGPTEILVMPSDSSNPNWNSSCVVGCTDSTSLNFDPLAIVDDGSCIPIIYGCTDINALNFYSGATLDDGSCIYPSVCTTPTPTGFYVSEVIHNRVRVHWDNMTSSICLPKQYRIQYREVGQTAWSQKNAQDAGLCNFGLSTTSKRITNLSPNTTYEWRMKAWYCNTTGASIWSAIQTFTTAPECPNVINFSVTTPLTTRAVFTWDTTGSYSFARIKLRIDSISNPTGTDWISAGGFGVNYPTLTRNKNGLTPGQTYRGQARTWCDPSGGMYKSISWTPLIFWTQPTSIRVDGGTAINNLDVYPNPSRDIFNVKFTSEDIQDLEVRIINVIGEVVYTENLEEFVGEYTKQVDLATYTKGVYFLEIRTSIGLINKKLILQ